MATAPNAKLPIVGHSAADRGSRAVVLGSDSNELVFAVVGHAGSGTTLVAKALAAVLRETSFNNPLDEAISRLVVGVGTVEWISGLLRYESKTASTYPLCRLRSFYLPVSTPYPRTPNLAGG